MNKEGFWISRLRVVGETRPPAELKFRKGLNTVTGASDTGKSYIMHLLQYMLGGKNAPKSIPEDRGYQDVLLEIRSYSGDSFVLARKLRAGGPLTLHEMSLDSWQAEAQGQQLSWKHTPGKTDTLPAFLLGLSGLRDRKVRRNVRGKTNELSFSLLRPFLLIDEIQVIEERSPVNPSGQHTAKTIEKSVFKLLLTGLDDSDVVEEKEDKIQVAHWEAQVTLLDDIIVRMRSEIETPRKDEETTEELSKFEGQVLEVTGRLAESTETVRGLVDERIDLQNQVARVESRLAVVDQLLIQFQLLDKQYVSDIERLDFISEGDYLLAQMGPAHCPICGQELSEGHQIDHEDLKAIRQGISAEIMKLKRHRTGLADSVATLESERKERRIQARHLRARLNGLNETLNTKLKPGIFADKFALKSLEGVREELALARAKREQIEALSEERDLLGPRPKRPTVIMPEPSVEESKARRDFCDALEQRLCAWEFPASGTVEFDSKMNLIVGGTPANSHGKGFRAVIHSAFAITLMYEARSTGHPGFVVVDSPLTSYKKKDDYDVPEDVQLAFFRDLASMPSACQVIVLENKEPREQEAFICYHFSGVPNRGRAGFYPPLKA